jgi:23S rRNA (uracil1939-C5)-methyltransferase
MFDGAPIVNGAFSQSSLLLNRLLVGLVKDTLGPVDSLLDLYCGNGNFSLQTKAKSVLGLDHDRFATNAANAIGRGTYRAADETAFCQALRQPWDAVVLDPPRTGAKAIINALAECQAQTIVYVSCDPATLARDLKTLTATGWQLLSTTAVDIFPNTPHIETVCQIKRD